MLRKRGILHIGVFLLGISLLLLHLPCCVSAWWSSDDLNHSTFSDSQLNQQPEPIVTTHQSTGLHYPRIVSDPISIYGDPEFHFHALINEWPGSGTPDNPYLIQNLSIDAEGVGSCISIWNTQVYFIINRCNLTGATVAGFMSGAGIVLHLVKNAVLVNNTCYGNLYGIHLGGVEYVNVTFNTCVNNDYAGLMLSSPTEPGINTNHIQWNTFANNPTNNVIDSGSSNHYACSYNYYSDYTGNDNNDDGIGETPYSIPGSSQNQDLYPLMFEPSPPTWNTSLLDLVLELGGSSSYPLEASSQPRLDSATWTINDTTHFEIDEHGVIRNALTTPVGAYGLRVRVENLYGIPLAGQFTVRVQDTTPPTWNCPDTFNVSFGGLVAIQLHAVDASGVVYWAINDLTSFSITYTGLLISNGILSIGNYELRVYVFDPDENTIIVPIVVNISSMDLTRIFLLCADIVVSVSALLAVWSLIRILRSHQENPE